MEALQRENAKLREELRALQAKYDDFENSTNEKIQKLIDENEILAEANRLLLEKQAGFDSIVKEPQLNQIPDELLLPGRETNSLKTSTYVYIFYRQWCCNNRSGNRGRSTFVRQLVMCCKSSF
jgi:predicted nuclease with TOPRIM domain